jgi:hemoglobin/transferrin/lactoferrin receptor protein
MNPRLTPLRLALLVQVGWPIAPWAAAEPAPEPERPLPELPPFVVTASGLAEPPFDAAHRVDAFGWSDIVQRSVRTLPDLLRETPGVYVQKTSHGQGSPFIRGFTGYHNVLLIDGIRLNNAAFRSGPNQYWATVDPYSLSAAELVRGQGSVLHGSDAVGGVLQAFTRGPVYADQGFLSSGRIFGRYASGERSYLGRIEGSVSEAGKFGFFLGGTWKDFGDIRAADLGILPQTGYGEWDGDMKFEAWLGPEQKLTLYHQQVRQDDAWRTHRTLYGRPWEGTESGNERVHAFDQDRLLSYARLDGPAESPWADTYRLTLWHQRQGEDRDRVRADGRRDLEGFVVDSYGGSLDFTRDLERLRATYGTNYIMDRGASSAESFRADGRFRERGIQGPFGTDAVYHLASAYVNTITPFGPRWDLQAGVRFTHAAVDIGRIEDPDTGLPFSDADSWNNVVGSVRAVAKPTDHLRLYGGISQAFRAPNFSDLSRLDANRSNEIETPSTGLDPEKFLTYELGARGDWKRFRAESSWWITDIRSLIIRTPTGAVIDDLFEVTKRNTDEGYVTGVDLSGEIDLTDSLSFFGSFGWNDGVLLAFPTSGPVAVEEPLSRLMPTQGFGGLRWEVGERLTLEGLVFAAAREDRLSAADARDVQRFVPGGTPGYTTATFRGLWRPAADLTISAGVENAFNEPYRIHGSGLNEPGTNVFFGFERTF